MQEGWKTYKLSELTSVITKGTTPSTYGFDFEESGINYIRAQSLNYNGTIDEKVFSFVSEDAHKKLKRSQLEEGDILFSMAGAYLGMTGMVKESHCPANTNQAVGIIRVNSDSINRKFVEYCLRNPSTVKYVNSQSGQSAQPNINLAEIGNLTFSYPPYEQQKSIASILSAIDDKIELNLAMNKTLEDMAMALYKHWFVDFGPFQDGEFVDSKLGMIPKAWEVKGFSEVTTKITDGAHYSPKSCEIGMPMASVKDMQAWGFDILSCKIISEEDYNKLLNQGCQPLKGDVVIAKDGSYLKHAFVVENDLDIVLLSSIAILKPNDKLDSHLLNLNLKLDSVKTRMKSIVSGAAIQRIVLKEFRKFLIIVPPLDVQTKALEDIRPLIERCWSNNNENQTLTKLRDTLLPKLISGEIRVKDVELTISEVL